MKNLSGRALCGKGHQTPLLMICLTFLIVLVEQVRATEGENAILRRYRPLAMEESWKVVRKPYELDTDRVSKVPIEDSHNWSSRAAEPADTLDGDPEDDKTEDNGDGVISKPEKEKLQNPLVDINNSNNVNISESMFAFPKQSTRALTKLITGKEVPTFALDKVHEPTIVRGSNNNVLASYNILVPILIPAVKNNASVLHPPSQKVNYVTETHTKMVPVTHNVDRVKTVIKAERVPQKIITDYVKVDGSVLPSHVGDGVKPKERVLESVVTNYD